MVTGSIARLGRQYVITLTVVNCQNGDSIARAQTDAANKEGVLSALGAATTRLRESLANRLRQSSGSTCRSRMSRPRRSTR